MRDGALLTFVKKVCNFVKQEGKDLKKILEISLMREGGGKNLLNVYFEKIDLNYYYYYYYYCKTLINTFGP